MRSLDFTSKTDRGCDRVNHYFAKVAAPEASNQQFRVFSMTPACTFIQAMSQRRARVRSLEQDRCDALQADARANPGDRIQRSVHSLAR